MALTERVSYEYGSLQEICKLEIQPVSERLLGASRLVGWYQDCGGFLAFGVELCWDDKLNNCTRYCFHTDCETSPCLIVLCIGALSGLPSGLGPLS